MLIEIILGERAPVADAPIQYSIVNEGFRATINGEAVFEPVALLRERFAKLRARDALLGAVLARLGADPGARESEAHAAVGKIFVDMKALEMRADTQCAVLNRIAQGLELDHVGSYENLEAAIFAQHEEITDALTCSRLEAEALTEALAKAQERIKGLEGDAERLHHACGVAKTHAKTLEGSRDSFIARADLAEAEVKALTEENARLKDELEASAKALEAANAKRERDFNAAREAQREIEKLKIRLAETDLDRVLAEARVDGLGAELKTLEHALRSRLPSP